MSVKQTTTDVHAWAYKPDSANAFMYFLLYFYMVCGNMAKNNPFAWEAHKYAYMYCAHCEHTKHCRYINLPHEQIHSPTAVERNLTMRDWLKVKFTQNLNSVINQPPCWWKSQVRFVSSQNISGSSQQNTVEINLGSMSIWNLGLHQTSCIEPFINSFFGCFLTFFFKIKKSPSSVV